ncbi:DUF1947 domain-containing protein [Methanocaldococcus infernus]|uniref:PUA domain containing protein n=1 Tax=Methanocaldococcus infernus (strain DSM 11812 / JCM 15783 / ME) TaxID=573063 RepID=D5VSW6_METIM|nr:RNA-binding protein [Methanocaldococcus infernus]ADG13669.1 PUA domain containing protein [Methanocaldococcus infernus ME]
MEIKKRHFLSKKDIKEIKEKLNFIELPKKGVELVVTDKYDILYVDEPVAFKFGDKWIPTLKALSNKEIKEKYAIVDMGAIKFLINGADVMAPGIVDADESIEKDDVVVVLDENHKKPICVGIALMSGKEMKEKSKGKAIKNLHYVGDDIWNLSK